MAAKNLIRLADRFRLPLEAVTEKFAVLGVSGSGKSTTAKRLAEQLVAAGQQVVVIDPTGVWWGLRSSRDGKSVGLPVTVLGGDRGDLPLDSSAGELVGELVVDESSSIVCDLSLMRKDEMRQFVLSFAETLYRRNREPLMLIVDEADLFAGQRMSKGEQPLVGAMEDLARRGRVKGIGLCLVSQRPASVAKDVLSQCSVLIAHRLLSPQDRSAIDSWVEANGTVEQRAELMESLASLPTGEAWFWSPSWLDVLRRVRVLLGDTFDSMETPPPGVRRVEPKVLSPVDIGVLRARMDGIVADAEANDPVVLRRRIAVLEEAAASVDSVRSELAVAQGRVAELVGRPVDVRVEPVEVMVEVLPEALLVEARELVGVVAGLSSVPLSEVLVAVEGLGRRVESWVASASSAASASASSAGSSAVPSAPVSSPSSPSPSRPSSSRTGRSSSRSSSSPGDAPKLKAGARRILETLARHHPMRMTTAQVGTLAKFKTSGGTFAAYKSTLRTGGYVTIDADGMWALTETGMNEVGHVPAEPMTSGEVLAMWRGALKAGARRMLDELVAFHPAPLTRDELAERVEMTATGGTFAAYLSTLKTNGLVVVDGQMVTASDTLFIAG